MKVISPSCFALSLMSRIMAEILTKFAQILNNCNQKNKDMAKNNPSVTSTFWFDYFTPRDGERI